MLLRVHRLECDALVGFREHHLFERSSLEQSFARSFPLLVGRRSEFIERNVGEILDLSRFLQKLLKFFVA